MVRSSEKTVIVVSAGRFSAFRPAMARSAGVAPAISAAVVPSAAAAVVPPPVPTVVSSSPPHAATTKARPLAAPTRRNVRRSIWRAISQAGRSGLPWWCPSVLIPCPPPPA
jgi:hypothetical protein